jgi:hypothetical protein
MERASLGRKWWKVIYAAPLLLLLTSLIGCSTLKIKTYVDPSFQSKSIRSIAIFPIRNVRLLPDEARQINQNISQQLLGKNPGVRILGPAESIDLLNKNDLSDAYSNFLRNFSLSGIPNTVTLTQIGNSLDVDAIFQGEIFEIYQHNGQFGVDINSSTSLTVHYVLLSTRNGSILWQATCSAKKNTATVFEQPPPLYEVILIANEKAMSGFPMVGK